MDRGLLLVSGVASLLGLCLGTWLIAHTRSSVKVW